VTFEKEQIVVWRGQDYKPLEDVQFPMEWDENPKGKSLDGIEGVRSSDSSSNEQWLSSSDDDESSNS